MNANLERFTRRPYRQKRLKDYYSRYSVDHTGVLVDDHVIDVLKAQGYAIESDPRSVYRVDKLYEALSAYAPGKVPKLKFTESIRMGIALAYKCFARPHLQQKLDPLPFTPGTIHKVTSNPSGSSGLTAYGVKKADAQMRAFERGLQTLMGEKQPEPCLAFARTQFNDKTRLVWGYPYSMTVIEGMLAYPLIQMFKERTTPMAFAMPSGVLGSRLRVASYNRKWSYSLDFSQFDSTIPAELIHVAFDILKTWFDLDLIEPTSGLTYAKVFELIEYYFIHTTIVMPDGHLYIGKRHGVPSGSYFTQMVDSVVNAIIAGTLSAEFHLEVDRHYLFILGDDLNMWSNNKVSLDALSRYVSETLHMKLHGEEKSKIFSASEKIHFLGRDWENGMPGIDEEEVIKRLVFPERFRKYSKDKAEATRQMHIMLLQMAATYRQGWRIATRCLNPYERNIDCGCAMYDPLVYSRERSPNSVDDSEFLSGLARYRRKYHPVSLGGDIPNTAYQIWL